jgi:hypothetical protein
VPQLLRDNAGDTRVVEDVAALAAIYDETGVAEASESARQTRLDDLALVAALFERSADEDDGPWLPRLVTHAKRYRTYYVVAALVVGVLLFRSPEPLPLLGGGDEANTIIPTVDSQRSASTTPTVLDPPLFADAESLTLPFFGVPSEAPAFNAPTPAPAPPPTALRLAQTGYASSLGGTPVDQEPPGNGLPVEAIAGRVTKYSYARLSGGGNTLKLKALTDDGASLNPGEARVQLCQITTKGWRPSRGTSATDAPAYAPGACLEGALKSGVWTFTFSSVYDPLQTNGWAIVPYLDGNVTFRVTFSPTAVTSA